MNTDVAWEQWGSRDPYYGVLTQPQFRAGVLTPEALELFFSTGRHHVALVLDTIRRHVAPDFAPSRILDFGCGVGRVVVPFAEGFAEVVGVDISPSMLAEARRNCDARGLANVSLVPSDSTLSAVSGSFDLVHSCIVLQHIEVPRGRALFAELARRIKPGGCGALHVTMAWSLHAATFGQPPPVAPAERTRGPWQAAKRMLRPPLTAAPPAETPVECKPDPEMQMNYYNLSELVFILHAAGVQRLHTELTDHGGAIGAFLYFQVPT